MSTIDNAVHRTDSQFFSGRGMVKHLSHKLDRNGNPYWYFRILLRGETLQARAWVGRCGGVTELVDGQVYDVTGQRDHFGLRCQTISAETRDADKAVAEAYFYCCLLADYLPAVHKRFLREVFLTDNHWQDFLRAQGSYHHHHAFPGGLFVHSVDMARRVFQIVDIPSAEKALLITAALLHDIGKIRCNLPGSHYADGIHHETLTLELLAKGLHWLDQHDKRLAYQLRALLTHKHQRHKPNELEFLVTQLRALDELSTIAALQAV